jgi:hypothetical protein
LLIVVKGYDNEDDDEAWNRRRADGGVKEMKWVTRLKADPCPLSAKRWLRPPLLEACDWEVQKDVPFPFLARSGPLIGSNELT